MKRLVPTAVLVSCLHLPLATSASRGDIVEYDDFDDWSSDVGSFTTIDFAEYPEFTIITDQYADLGMVLGAPGALVLENPGFPPDGHGVVGAEEIDVRLDGPRFSFGTSFIGSIAFRLYLGGDLVATEIGIQLGDAGSFSGFVSDDPFDQVIIYKVIGAGDPFVGDIYFGPVVPAPAAWCVGFAVLGLGARRRRGA